MKRVGVSLKQNCEKQYFRNKSKKKPQVEERESLGEDEREQKRSNRSVRV